MAEQFIGQIMVTAFDFAPQGWALCNGQSMPVQQYLSLFGVIGTSFGGNGVTTFNLPDFRSRIPVGAGQGPSTSAYTIGQSGGTETVTLDMSEIPAHTHTVPCNDDLANTTVAGGAVWGVEPQGVLAFYTDKPADGTMGPTTVSSAGSGLPHLNLQPFICLSYCIALTGTFPVA